MAKVTSINVLLDVRAVNNYELGLKWVVLSLKDTLEKARGINLFYLADRTSGDEQSEDEKKMYEDSDFSSIDVFISAEKNIPDAINKVIEITKYAILDGILSGMHGNVNAEWYEDSVKSYKDKYDYFITFSEIIKKLFFNAESGIQESRVICLQLSALEKRIKENASKVYKLSDVNKNYVVFYKSKYARELKIAAKAFINIIKKEDNPEDIFVLACLDKEENLDEEICKLFENYKDNFRMVYASSEDEISDLMCEASFFVDIFWLDDINYILLEELAYDSIVISNSLTIEDEKIVKVNNSVLEYENAFEKVKKCNVVENEQGGNEDKKENYLVDTIIKNENLKREMPLVTIVTITYNLIQAGRKETIQQCIESVHNQTYKNIEHIIIDGASTDGTLELLHSYEQKGWIDIFSEKDSGLYDAMNKGIYRARGKYIAFLNSDDFYHDMQGIEKTVCMLQKTQTDYTFSNTNILNEDGSIYYWIADIGNMLYARNYCHQSMFVRLDVMKELNGFDLKYRVSSDSDLMIRIFEKGYSYVKTDYSFVTYRGGGLSATTAEESRIDHSYSFYLHLGNKYGLTSKECYELWQYRFLDELPANLQQRLISKIPSFFNSEMVLNEYLRRQTHTVKISLKRKIAQKVPFEKLHISRRMRVKNGRNEMVYYFCRVIPIWVTKERI